MTCLAPSVSRALVASLAAAVALSGCITLGKPPKASYLPDYSVFESTVRPSGGPTVYLQDATAAPGYDTYAMVERSTGAEIVERNATEWKMKPAELVTRKFFEHVLASGKFSYPRSSTLEAEMRLHPIVRRFDEMHEGAVWSAVFAVDIEIMGKDGQAVTYLRLPEVKELAATADPQGVAAAMARAMHTGLDQAVAAAAAR